MSTSEIRQTVKDIVAPWKGRPGGLIPILQKVQNALGYLPNEAMKVMSDELKISLGEIYGVITFYAQFHLKPRGRNIVRVCRGTACHVRGSLPILNKVKEILKIGDNETTPDLRFTLEPVACIGACGLAPVIMINEDTHGRLTLDKLQPILDQYN